MIPEALEEGPCVGRGRPSGSGGRLQKLSAETPLWVFPLNLHRRRTIPSLICRAQQTKHSSFCISSPSYGPDIVCILMAFILVALTSFVSA